MAFYVLMEPFSIKATIWSTPILCGTNINYAQLDEILSEFAFIFSFNVCFKKIWTNYSTVSLLRFVQVFLKQTLLKKDQRILFTA